MTSPFKCSICDEPFDSDLELLDSGGRHHLPVSCGGEKCSYTVCHECFVGRVANGQKFIECPQCQSGVGFYAADPNILPFACLLLREAQKKPGAVANSKNTCASSEGNVAVSHDHRVSQEDDNEQSRPGTNSPVCPVARRLRLQTAATEEAHSATASNNSKDTAVFDMPKVTQSQSSDTDDCSSNQMEIEDESPPPAPQSSRTPATRESKAQPAVFRRSSRKREALSVANSGETDEERAVVTPPRKKPRQDSASTEALAEQPSPYRETEAQHRPAVSHENGRQLKIDTFFGKSDDQNTSAVSNLTEGLPRPKKLDCSPETYEQLKKRNRWLNDFNDYLINILKCSESNRSKTMEQANKLCLGAGIESPYWRPAGIRFMKGYEIDLTIDFEQMHQDAKAFLEKYGADESHGWRLLHPIRKIHKFQKFLLEQPGSDGEE